MNTSENIRTGLRNGLVRIIESNKFFYFTLLVCAAQGIWYALSFQPSIFDEGRHLGNILIYSHHLSPFLGAQNPAWDHLGEITRDGSFLFYYLMSWPLRVIRLFTSDNTLQIIGLRFICIAFFVGGLALYRKALLGIRQASVSAVHLALLFLILTPAVAPLPGAVNYDNLVFLLFALLLFLSVKTINRKDVSFLSLSAIFITGVAMSLVKWAAFPLFLPVALFLIYDLYKKHGRKSLSLLITSAKRSSRPWLIVAVVGIVLSGGLFVERPVLNVLKYHQAEPNCQKVIGPARCKAFPDYVIYSSIYANKPANFRPISQPKYFTNFWAPRMVNTQISLLPWGKTKLSPSLPVMALLYFGFAGVGTVLFIAFYRDFIKLKAYRFLFFVTGIYALVLFLDLYAAYVKYAAPAAISGRYLIPVLPIFMYFVGVSFIGAFGRHKNLLALSLCGVLLLMTQGGGIITHSLTAKDGLYWQNHVTLTANKDLQNILHPLVKE